MSISTIQNFYKETITRAVTLTGATNIYVSALPTPSEGYVVISPSSSSLREIVYYTAKGTDGNGSYLTVTADNRGLGGTTAQTHVIGEPVRMNVTAEHIKEISDALDQIVAGGAQDASTITKGITKLSVAPESSTEPIAVGDNDPRVPVADPTTLFAPIKFGGTGADGALEITSGATNIDLGGAQVVTKNYTSISITGTGSLTFSNPHANGTIIILKSQGDVTITSSTVPAVDLRNIGASVTNPATANILAPTGGSVPDTVNGIGGVGGTKAFAPTIVNTKVIKHLLLGCGAGGASGGMGNGKKLGGGGGASLFNNGTGGSVFSSPSGTDAGPRAGGRGGGCLYIECGGACNVSSTIDASGTAGGDSVAITGNGLNGGGGGGGGGVIVILYNFLTANTGTYTVSGGSGGFATAGGNGGAGGNGYSLVALNTEFN